MAEIKAASWVKLLHPDLKAILDARKGGGKMRRPNRIIRVDPYSKIVYILVEPEPDQEYLDNDPCEDEVYAWFELEPERELPF